MAGSPYSLWFLALFMPLLCLSGEAQEEIEFKSILVGSLISSPNCTQSKGVSDRAVPVIHRGGPCAAKARRKYNVLQVIEEDALRVESLHSIVSAFSDSKLSVPAKSGAYIGTGNYVVTVGIGTPKRDQTLEFDTGSFVNWIQCEPCSGSCYSQEDPIFDPSVSSTYRSISCSSPVCSLLPDGSCGGETCEYKISYSDGSVTAGTLAADTFSLNSFNVFQSVIFGCGQNNEGLLKGSAGLIGLGRSPLSLNSQVSAQLGNIFSYCLPSSSDTTGFLNIGPPVGANAVYTPLVNRSADRGLYFIDLVGILVGGRSLPIPVEVFLGPGTVLDSGTVITRLPPAAYEALRAAFREAMVKYTLVPGTSLLDTCYDFRGFKTVYYPSVELQYNGARVSLSFEGIFHQLDSGSICLAFAANPSPTRVGIIGNTQQKTFEVIHDNVGNRIGFVGRACS